jgi:mobilization protein NikA
MAVLKRRSRLVTFRVSNDEYETLQRVCAEAGVRSVSDFARSAVNYRAQILNAPQKMLAQDLSTLSSELVGLDATLREMRERIGRLLGRPVSAAAGAPALETPRTTTPQG